MSTATEKIQKGYRLPVDMIVRVGELADRRRVSPCKLVEQAINDMLSRYETIDRFPGSSENLFADTR